MVHSYYVYCDNLLEGDEVYLILSLISFKRHVLTI